MGKKICEKIFFTCNPTRNCRNRHRSNLPVVSIRDIQCCDTLHPISRFRYNLPENSFVVPRKNKAYLRTNQANSFAAMFSLRFPVIPFAADRILENFLEFLHTVPWDFSAVKISIVNRNPSIYTTNSSFPLFPCLFSRTNLRVVNENNKPSNKIVFIDKTT